MIDGEGGLWNVISTSESDDKGVVIGGASGVLSLIGDGDGLDFTFCQGVVGVVGRIEGPGAVWIDVEALSFCGNGVALCVSDDGGEE